jgi:hypothetical protein
MNKLFLFTFLLFSCTLTAQSVEQVRINALFDNWYTVNNSTMERRMNFIPLFVQPVPMTPVRVPKTQAWRKRQSCKCQYNFKIDYEYDDLSWLGSHLKKDK